MPQALVWSLALLVVLFVALRRFLRRRSTLDEYRAEHWEKLERIYEKNRYETDQEALRPALAALEDIPRPAGVNLYLETCPATSGGEGVRLSVRHARDDSQRTDGPAKHDREILVLILEHTKFRMGPANSLDGQWLLRVIAPNDQNRQPRQGSASPETWDELIETYGDLAAFAARLEQLITRSLTLPPFPTKLSPDSSSFAIIGGGLAGCECALALARAGLDCTLYEQKPDVFSPAHSSPNLGELVCSNSFRSNDAAGSGVGLLKQEMRDLGSAVMAVADRVSVPAGKALAVDRDKFSAELTSMVEGEPHICLIRRSIHSLDDPELAGKTIVIAAGPLASADLIASLTQIMGEKSLYFYDAIAPIISAESIDTNTVFRGSRYGNDGPPPPYLDGVLEERATATGFALMDAQACSRTTPAASAPATEPDDGDYLNCPMTRAEYETFYQALLAADKVPAHDFETEIHFEGCMPIEALAERGERTLTFGPLKPVGFTDPRTDRRPWALVQLRAENAERTAYNLVGCQTKMTYAAQAKVFRLIPGLEQAEFLRFGSVHRNTYVNAPESLTANLALKARSDIYLAGQITGVEGYVESSACGLWVGLLLAARASGNELLLPPPTTALGALLRHLQTPAKHFQPSNVHFGLMPDLPEKPKKKARKAVMAERAREAFGRWQNTLPRPCASIQKFLFE